MACVRPFTMFRSAESNPPTGKHPMTLNPLRSIAGAHSSYSVPCGTCIGCRLDRSKEWAARCLHESKMWSASCFVTLTYDNKHLPEDYSVAVRPLQLFFKRLRKSLDGKIRFYAVGEYGSDNYAISETPLRPHYHALIFNYSPSDKRIYKRSGDTELYTSQSLENLWPFGFSTVGDLTYQTAAYCARYSMKKIGGDGADDHYTRIHPLSGNLVRVKPEFSTMSRGGTGADGEQLGGIGRPWFDAYAASDLNHDFIVVDGKKHSVPKYYQALLPEEQLHKFKIARRAEQRVHRADHTPARLRDLEVNLEARVNQLRRKL